MKAIDIKRALRKAPFKPFTISLVNGETLEVDHPDCFLFSRKETSCVLADKEGFNIFDLDQVSRLTFKVNGRRPKKRARS